MTVGFDARLMAHETQPTGVGYYARQLVQHLMAEAVAVKLYTDQPYDADQPGSMQRVVPTWSPLPWQQTALIAALWRDRPSVYHSPRFTLPLWSPVPTVVTIHDLAFDRYPDYMNADDQRYLSSMVPKSLVRADRIITDSTLVKNELITRYNLSSQRAARIKPIWLGVDTVRWHPRSMEEILVFRKRHGLSHPYLLFVGTREPRKNLSRLVQAFHVAAMRLGTATRLLLVGPDGCGNQALQDLIAKTPQVDVLPYVSAEDLPLIMQGAEALCYVSEYEGFGLPVLEAMAVGTPVITSQHTAMEEVAKDDAIYVDPLQMEAIAAILEALMRDPKPFQQRAQQAIMHAQELSWTKTARQTLAIYRELSS